MKLGAWLTRNDVGQAEFAARIGISQGQVSRLVSGARGRRISASLAQAIDEATGGQVPVSSWAKHLVRRNGRRSPRNPTQHSS
jgi:DNA-binding transcriptional regulator YdaS (Cro superfamily)